MPPESKHPFHIAIIGGGLCGISLALALKAHTIPFTLYESRSSFTEIGAGINFGPSAVRTLRLIAPSLGEKVYQLATRNPPPGQETWMEFKYGADDDVGHKEGETFYEMKAPPTGSMTLHRQELLKGLAEEMGEGCAKFNKKLSSYENHDDHVSMTFEDGSVETASILVGCDGIHSKVRRCMFGEDDPISKPIFDGKCVYRAVLPMEKVVSAIDESVRSTQIHLGPGGYLISYPVNGGTAMNCGLWFYRDTWDSDEWIVPEPEGSFEKAQEGWGPKAHKILSLYDPNPPLWGAFQHSVEKQPDHFVDGRVILIGDGAHSMPPHQGAGAATAVEDAYIVAEVLSQVDPSDTSLRTAEVALKAVEKVRVPRSSTIHRYSSEAGPMWFDFYGQKREGKELEQWIEKMRERLNWIWNFDMEKHAEEAKEAFREMLGKTNGVNGHAS